jgi:hypothetical protein
MAELESSASSKPWKKSKKSKSSSEKGDETDVSELESSAKAPKSSSSKKPKGWEWDGEGEGAPLASKSSKSSKSNSSPEGPVWSPIACADLSWKDWLENYRGACSLRTALLTPKQSRRCMISLDDLARPTAKNYYTNDFRVRSLHALKNVQRVSGVIEVSNCQHLERFDGAFAQLKSVGKTWLHSDDRSYMQVMTVRNNTRLRGVVTSMFPALPLGMRSGSISNNPDLCSNPDDSRFGSAVDNKPSELCTCESYTELCDVVQCKGCAPGTSGNCFFKPRDWKASQEKICIPREPGTDLCPFLPGVGQSVACDLCEGHEKCDDAPQCKKEGTCNPTTGMCEYAQNKGRGAHCDDGSLFTGPDVCDDMGTCTTTDACIVSAKRAGSNVANSALFAVALKTQTEVDEFSRCGTIQGTLNIDCEGNTAANTDPITNIDALEEVAKVTGALRVANCPLLTTIAFRLLQDLEGLNDAQSIVLSRNVNLKGGIHGIFPAMSSLHGGVEATNNPQLCMNSYDWSREVVDRGNAPPEECGCTDSTMMNYKATATIDDGLCIGWPCDGTGSDGVQTETQRPCQHDANDCRTKTCNVETNKCEFAFFECSDAGCCDDGDKFTVDDQCKPGSNGGTECRGTDVCDDDVQAAFCNEHDAGRDELGDAACTFLSYCSVPDDRSVADEDTACIWEVRPEGTMCDTVRL